VDGDLAADDELGEKADEGSVGMRSLAEESDLAATLDEVAQFDANEVQDVLRRWHPRENLPSRKDLAEKIAVHRGEGERLVDDDLHTFGKLTKFEFARIIGVRVAQLNSGSPPYVETDLVDSHLIACEEMRQKKLPFIVRRFMPDGEEYHRLCDLENLCDV